MIIGLFIFCLVLFIYLHVIFHLKTSEDLEMYEVNQLSKDKFEEICDLRQPAIFESIFDDECSQIINYTNQNYILNTYNAFDIKIRNVKIDDINSEMYVPLQLSSAVKLFEEDKTASYFSENNLDFLEETNTIKHIQHNDTFLRPYMVSNCDYDILMGSNNTRTPFKYDINYRNFFLLTQGSARIKLTIPHSSKYLHTIYDYEAFEFKSPINPWEPQQKYITDFNKIKCLEFTLLPGKILFIPAYWWYSIQFENKTSITQFKYRTYMNNLAILPQISLHFLQLQNIKRNTVNKKHIQELNTLPNYSNQPEVRENVQITNCDSQNSNTVTTVDTNGCTNITDLPPIS